MSLTMIENNKGPSTVPWGTPLLTLRKLVTTSSTTAHYPVLNVWVMSYDTIVSHRERDGRLGQKPS